jgi:hypothetical protein
MFMARFLPDLAVFWARASSNTAALVGAILRRRTALQQVRDGWRRVRDFLMIK